ncbi:hypothetical protein ABBQ32_003560 [Trebouxia sp. C0010 RCD-2024]
MRPVIVLQPSRVSHTVVAAQPVQQQVSYVSPANANTSQVIHHPHDVGRPAEATSWPQQSVSTKRRWFHCCACGAQPAVLA